MTVLPLDPGVKNQTKTKARYESRNMVLNQTLGSRLARLKNSRNILG